MSLDVWLRGERQFYISVADSIVVREDGANRKLSRAEWDQRFPGIEPVSVSVSVSDNDELYAGNITHNLGAMAADAGIYKHLWRPEDLGITRANALIEPLTNGLALLQGDPDRFRKFNAANGWGRYENLVAFVENYLLACQAHPNAMIGVSR